MGYLDLLGYAGGRGYRGLLQGTGGTVGYWGLGVIVGTGGYSGLLQVLGVLRGTWGTLGVLQVLWGTVGNYGVLQVPYNNHSTSHYPSTPQHPPVARVPTVPCKGKGLSSIWIAWTVDLK